MSNQLQKPQAALKKSPELKSLLSSEAIRARFEQVLGGKRAPAFLSSILSAVNANPYLSKCDPMSVVSAAAVAASLDLPINQSLGFAHIVPYSGVAQFQMGWKGFIQLALRSGQYKTINVSVVREGQLVKHNPFTGDMEFQETATSNEVIGYLLFFRLISGYEKYFYMTADQCEAHGKKFSKTYQMGKGRWAEDFDAMALKTVAKLGLSKYGILSVDMQTAVAIDEGEAPANEGDPVKYPDSTELEAEKLPWEQEVVEAPAEAPKAVEIAKEIAKPFPFEVKQTPKAEVVAQSPEQSGEYVVQTGLEKGIRFKDKPDIFWVNKRRDLLENKENFPPKVKESAQELLRALEIYLGQK